MGRKRIIEESALHSWEDVNAALREIAEEQIALGEIENDMQKQLLGIKMTAEQQSKPHADRISKLEHDIKDFAMEHRAELGKTKNKVLTFGKLGFQLSTAISLPKAKEKLEDIIRRLKVKDMHDCIVTEEKISKDALRKYGEDTVNAVGATWKQKDTFGYEVYMDKLRLGERGASS